MSSTTLQNGGRAFQKFVSHLTRPLSKPAARFVRDLLCGILFSDNLTPLSHITDRTRCRLLCRGLRARMARAGLSPLLCPLQNKNCTVSYRSGMPKHHSLLEALAL